MKCACFGAFYAILAGILDEDAGMLSHVRVVSSDAFAPVRLS